MPRKSIQVSVRTRPTSNFAQDELFVDAPANTIAVSPDTGPYVETMGPNNQQSNFKFNFHNVMHNVSQETVYDSLARDVVQGVADGINGTIMSYGQTGSGKTFTMIGDTSNYQHRGIAPRSLSHIFSEIGMRMETHFTITCTYMEIYNERIFDLLESLDGPPNESKTHEFTIAEDKGGRGVHVRGLTEVKVTTEQEALNLLFSGELGRTTAQHKLNRRSNRSHSIFTVYVAQRSRSGVSDKVISSKLNIVDLAGSERLKKTMEGGGVDMGGGAPIDDTLKKESMHINQSLTYLEQCVVALSRKGPGGAAAQAHVPYRQTKLTNVLKDALGGNCNTLLIACIWGESAHLEETISTLRLANRMMRVQNQSVAVEVTDPVKLVKKQEQIIKELKQELLMHDALADRTGVLYDPYTPEQQEELRKTLEKYLNSGSEAGGGGGGRGDGEGGGGGSGGGGGDDDDDALLGSFHSVRQMRETCRLFKDLYKQQQETTHRLVTAASAMGGVGGGLGATTAQEAAMLASMGLTGNGAGQGGNGGEGGGGAGGAGAGGGAFGDLEGGGGFGLGRAPDGARPTTVERGAGMGSRGAMGTGCGGNGAGGGGGMSPERGGRVGAGSRAGSISFGGGAPVSPTGTRGRGAGCGGGHPSNTGAGGGGGFGGGMGGALADRDTAFVVYKSGAGKAINAELGRCKARLKNFKARSKACAASINDSKARIDELSAQVEEKKQQRLQASKFNSGGGGKKGGGSSGLAGLGDEDDVVDEEEFRLMKKQREAKKVYRAAYEDLAALKEELEGCSKQVDTLKVDLIGGFEEWHQRALEDSQPKDLFGDTGKNLDDTGFGDELDDQEAFEQMETERVMSNDPESLAFFQAQKTRRANQTQNYVKLKQVQHNKRYR